MLIVKASGLAKEWGGKRLFEHVDLELFEGEHVALYGCNGVGKTSLLRGLLGLTPFESGTVRMFVPPSERGMLEQRPETDESLTALEFVQSGSPEHVEARRALEEAQERMNGANTPASSEAADPQRLLDMYGQAYERYIRLQGYEWEAKVERSMQRMKLDAGVWGLPFAKLSGGQKTRVQLARLMVREPKLMLMDEPTNHLDRESLELLEQWVNAYPGAIVFVSHDRWFLDKTAHAVYELTPGGLTKYKGGYSAYRECKELELRTQEQLYKKQERKREQLLECIRSYRQWYQQAARAAGKVEVGITKAYYAARANKNIARYHAKQKELERLEKERVEKPKEAPQLNVRLEGERLAARTLLRLSQVCFSYSTEPGNELLADVNASLERNDRLAVIGPNGAGKSTLLKLLVGQLQPAAGTIWRHPQLRVGYLSQELDNMNAHDTILDSLLIVPGMTEAQARTILGCFLFSRDDAYKTVGSLSMGEKCRLAFLKLMFGGVNLLVLDEPTNYLDVASREKLEEALAEYEGALVIVSHDRYLLARTANRIASLEGGRITLFPGTYAEFAERAEQRVMTDAERDAEDERSRLELRLTQLMSDTSAQTPEEQARVLEEVRRIRERCER